MQANQNVNIIFVYYYDLLKFFHHLTTAGGAHKKYKAIKEDLNKADHQYITVEEFAAYSGLPTEKVIEVLSK